MEFKRTGDVFGGLKIGITYRELNDGDKIEILKKVYFYRDQNYGGYWSFKLSFWDWIFRLGRLSIKPGKIFEYRDGKFYIPGKSLYLDGFERFITWYDHAWVKVYDNESKE